MVEHYRSSIQLIAFWMLEIGSTLFPLELDLPKQYMSTQAREKP